ncbi:amidohydrolase family protein [Altererythrobacter sp.]|uniref:amidohydrolase family protein n=1 Tax=Altererythrobacter sp. TaxID=1872480 RepID=UPI003D02431E
MKRFPLFAAAAIALSPAPLAAQDFAITNATVAKGDGSAPIEGASVVVRGGKIVAAGSGVTVPTDVPVMDGSGMWVTPGLVAAVTDLGLADVGAVDESNDNSASKARFNAALDVAPAINPASQNIAISRAGGLTRAIVAPSQGASLFAGQGAVIDLGADPEAIEKAQAFQLAALGENGASLSGGSRTAAHVELRNALAEAIAYANGRWDGAREVLPRMDAKALAPVVSGKQKLFVEVERASDILAVIALKKEFPKLDLVLVGVSEGWLVANAIAASGVPVIADPLDDLPSKFEQLAATQSNVGRMVRAGVKVALGRMAGTTDGHPRSAAQFAGNLVALNKLPGAAGLSWGQALASISSVPAEIAGLGGKIGVLKPGAAGDVVVWDGDPLEVSTAPVKVFIDGVEQPLDNHQTRLRERYRNLDESTLPKAYDW